MKSLIAVFLIGSLLGTCFAQDPGWPREKTNAGGTLIYYQPQRDEWKEFRRLEAHGAVSIKATGGQPTVGIVYLRASTDANPETENNRRQRSRNHLDAIPVAGCRRCRCDGSAR